MRPLLFLLVILVFAGCKKEETEPEEYMPYAEEIIGSWRVVASFDNTQNKLEAAYPNNIDPYIITFTNRSTVDCDMPCNSGGAYSYIVSESGSISFGDFVQTNLFCDNASSIWESRVKSACENAYHSRISNNSLFLYSNGIFDLKLVKE